MSLAALDSRQPVIPNELTLEQQYHFVMRQAGYAPQRGVSQSEMMGAVQLFVAGMTTHQFPHPKPENFEASKRLLAQYMRSDQR